MWTRKELKTRGKAAFKKNYWRCVLVAFILAIVTSAGGTSNSQKNNQQNESTYEANSTDLQNNYNITFDSSVPVQKIVNQVVNSLGGVFRGLPIGLVIFSISLGAMIAIIGILVHVFVFNVIEVGGAKFFIENMYDNPETRTVLCFFRDSNYITIVVTQLLREVFTILWTLLLIIPGIVKSYEYCMIPYLLAENPEMTRSEAFRISKEMMHGNKMATFILDLSFIGWHILSALTMGLLGVFYVSPYIYATRSELYEVLRKNG